jgi:hypothetical protein
LGQVIGQCAALTPAQTVAEKNRAEGGVLLPYVKRRLRFCQYILLYLLHHIYLKLYRVISPAIFNACSYRKSEILVEE